MEDIILIGYGGHAKSVAETIVQVNQFHIVGYIDKKPSDRDRKYQWLGDDDKLAECYQSGIHKAAICIGYMGHCNIRDQLYGKLKTIGYELPVIIDHSAVIAQDVRIGEGTYVGKGAIINADATIGKMVIINSGVLIEHENVIGDFSHIAVRATLCGTVHVGRHAFVGANAVVKQGVFVGEECTVGAGSVILRDIPKEKTVYGIY